MKLEFKPADFNLTDPIAKMAANQANARLAEMLEDASTVIGRFKEKPKRQKKKWFASLHNLFNEKILHVPSMGLEWIYEACNVDDHFDGVSFKAKLVEIEEIK